MIVVLDSCVLFPAPLRDFLMHLTLLDVIRSKWTNDIHDEWIRNVLKIRPDLNKEKLDRTRRLMDLHSRDSLVGGYESLIPKLHLPDPDDRHVLAAAIKSGAEAIITFNIRDFPKRELSKYGIAAISPDNLISDLFPKNKESICLAFSRQLASLTNPPLTKNELLDVLRNQRLVKTVVWLEDNCG